MPEAAATRLSSRAVVIPERIRKRLGPQPGALFVVVADRDAVILTVQTVDMAEF
jgi:bifunctional DNA-binding transcriptional regulator/antitoxin component of YhaV-PrlF toxin-antitoxin module